MSRSTAISSISPRSGRATSTTTIMGPVEPPPRQPIAHAFSTEGLASLGALPKSKNLDDLVNLHEEAIGMLTECAADLQELAKTRKQRKAKEKEKQRVAKGKGISRSNLGRTVRRGDANGAESESEDVEMQDEEDEEEEEDSQSRDQETFSERANQTTKSIDLHLRKLIDGTQELSDARKIISGIHLQCQTDRQNSLNGMAFSISTPAVNFSQGASQMLGRGTADTMNSSVTAPGETQVPGSETSLTQPAEVFQREIKAAKEKYQMMSMRARYSEHKHYVEFKQQVWEATHGLEIPLPHKNTWFPEDDVRASPLPGNVAHHGMNGKGPDDESDDDIQTIRVTISTKCPITFAELQNPVSSRKCPHVFEKTAIEQFIRQRRMESQQNRSRGNLIGNPKCPAAGCDMQIGLDDLYVNGGVVRKIKRVQELKKRERDMDVDEDEIESGSRSRRGEFQDVDDDEEDFDD